jgi:hypothetical protein
MSNPFVTLVAVYATFLLTSSAFGQTPPFTSININANNGGTVSSPSTFANGPSSLETGFLPGPGLVQGKGTASFAPGSLSVYADASSYATPDTTAHLDVWSEASYLDTVLFDAGPYGSYITITSAWLLHGKNTTIADPHGTGTSDPVAYVTVLSDAKLSLAGTGITNGGPPVLIAENEIYAVNIPGDSPYQIDIEPPSAIPLTFTAFSGILFQINVTLVAEASADVNSFDNITYNGGGSEATADFGHTLLWGGISSIKDSQGNPITNWSVTSDSGFNYAESADVPEPSTFLLLTIGLSCLFLVRRHTSATRKFFISDFAFDGQRSGVAEVVESA